MKLILLILATTNFLAAATAEELSRESETCKYNLEQFFKNNTKLSKQIEIDKTNKYNLSKYSNLMLNYYVEISAECKEKGILEMESFSKKNIELYKYFANLLK